MNAKKSKLLRKLARSKREWKAVKKGYNLQPTDKKAAISKELREELSKRRAS